MSTTYKTKFVVAAIFAAIAVYAVLNDRSALAAFSGAAVGVHVMDGVWSGWWKSWKSSHASGEAA